MPLFSFGTVWNGVTSALFLTMKPPVRDPLRLITPKPKLCLITLPVNLSMASKSPLPIEVLNFPLTTLPTWAPTTLPFRATVIKLKLRVCMEKKV